VLYGAAYNCHVDSQRNRSSLNQGEQPAASAFNSGGAGWCAALAGALGERSRGVRSYTV